MARSAIVQDGNAWMQFSERWQNALESIELPSWACSSVGRAPALQAGGRGFESPHVHQPSACNFNHLLIRPAFNFAKLGNIWEQLIFKLIDGLPLRDRAGVRVHFERGRHVRVAELSLRHAERCPLLV